MFAVPRSRMAERPEAVPVIVPLESASDPLSAFSTERAAEPGRDRSGVVELRPHREHGVPLARVPAEPAPGSEPPPSPRGASVPAARRLIPIAFAVGVLAGVAGASGLAARTKFDPVPAVAPPLLDVMGAAVCMTPAAASVPAQLPLTPAPLLADRAGAAAPVPASTTVARAAAAPPTGSLAIAAPFLVHAFVDGTLVGDSSSPRLTVPAGAHELRLVSDELEFAQVTSIDVTARTLTRLVVERPLGTLNVNAQPWAQVWVDGRRVGETPLGNLRLPIGAHDIVLRHPTRGEERRSVLIGARTPVHLGVEFPR